MYHTVLNGLNINFNINSITKYSKSIHLFLDNFYTRHKLSNILFVITDGNLHTIGTMRTNYITQPNKLNVLKSMTILNNIDKGAWIIVAHNHTVVDCTHLASPQTSKKITKSLGYILSQYTLTTSDHVAYIAWKDSKALTLYTNECDPRFKLANKFTHSDEKNEKIWIALWRILEV